MAALKNVSANLKQIKSFTFKFPYKFEMQSFSITFSHFLMPQVAG